MTPRVPTLTEPSHSAHPPPSAAPTETGAAATLAAPLSLPSGAERHLLRRFAPGFNRDTFRELRRTGGAAAWFEQQLKPGSIDDPRTGTIDAFFSDRLAKPADKWSTHLAGTKSGWAYATELTSWRMMRRMRSARQVHETVIDMWMNHLYVPAEHDAAWAHGALLEKTIRDRALGTYAKLLHTVTLHPAMLLSLNAVQSTREHPNENHGRELLELHTVGGYADYTEADVLNAARVLTGYTVDEWGGWHRYYDPSQHWVGPVRVLGWRHDNAAADGRPVVASLLTYLAQHRATAQTVAHLMATRFVSDSPSTTLVNDLADVYQANDSAIRPMLRALIAHPEFASSQGAKVLTAPEDVIATARALGITPLAPSAGQWDAFAFALVWACRGQHPGSWPMPDGAPDTQRAWLSPGRMLSSFAAHYDMCGQWFAADGTARYRPMSGWVPSDELGFDDWVDHLCRVVLGRRAPASILAACRQAIGATDATRVRRDGLEVWQFARVMAAILDTPEFMTR